MKKPKIRFLLRVLLSSGLIALLLSRLDWSAVAELLRGAHRWPLVAGSLLGVSAQFLMAERTRLMLRHWMVDLSHRNACSVTWVGQFCNNFLPGGIGGDMVKFYRVGRLYPHARAATLVALVADRLMALVALVGLSSIALAFGEHDMLWRLFGGVNTGSLPKDVTVWWITLLLAATMLLLASGFIWRFRKVIIDQGSVHVRRIRDAIASGRRMDGSIMVAFVLAVAVHAIGMICIVFFARALAIPLGVGQVFLVWPVVLVAMMMPVSVNGYGLREFILLYYFERWHLVSHLGVGAGIKESVIALSLLSVVNDLLCNLPGGLLLLTSDAPAAKEVVKSVPQNVSSSLER